MTAEELITLARENLGEPNIDNVTDAVLSFYGHGVPSDVTGHVEAPTGHVIRVDRWIVLTNEQGFTTLEDYDSEEIAIARFASYEDAYADWSNESEVD